MSHVFIGDVLRTAMHYDGVVFSDSLDMKVCRPALTHLCISACLQPAQEKFRETQRNLKMA